MHPKGKIIAAIRFALSGSSWARNVTGRNPSFIITPTRYSTICLNEVEGEALECLDNSNASIESFRESNSQNEGDQAQVNRISSVEVLRRWGCSEDEISKLLSRRPVLQRADAAQLDFKLSILDRLGITSSDLVKIVNCRPRFLSSRINRFFDERIDFLTTFFGSKEELRKAIIRNPSLMTYDLCEKIKPVIELYKGFGLSRGDLIQMLISRPTLIPRTNFNSEKIEYIHKTGVSSESKMFKYVVSLIGVSRMETIQEKVANLEKFGFSEEEVWHMIGKSPLILTLSVEKVQRNMTFIVASMKLPAHSILRHPFLLYCNLESHLRPRVLLSKRIEEMGLQPQIKRQEIFRVLRMREKRFLRVFVNCHPEEVAADLMESFKGYKAMKRLAEESKKSMRKGFPF
ncbi:PREDICTED: uncharacterized protein LOC104813610 [Tarenaya hassleriana]|uniref:uncharacterized protein LOC104813610 n=1 Tax=Tarenaya hassleriana TaxID=28532 RepID=UPI00053C2C36|nr:PREDICTED: uncharacterized protein LOC104813610 [Tarenaya hassleriana]